MRYNAAQLELLYAIGLPPDLPENEGLTEGSEILAPELESISLPASN